MPKAVALPSSQQAQGADGLTEELAFGQSGATGQDEEVEMALGKGIHERLELGVGAHDQGALGTRRRLRHSVVSWGLRGQSNSLIGFGTRGHERKVRKPGLLAARNVGKVYGRCARAGGCDSLWDWLIAFS